MTCKIDYTANGSIVAFPFPFAIPAKSALEVRVNDAVREIGFKIAGAGAVDGGTVIFDSAPAAGDVISLRFLGAVTVGVNDAAAGHLADKLVAGSGVSLSTESDIDGVERLRINAVEPADMLQKSLNLADVPNKEQACENLGVYTKTGTNTAINNAVSPLNDAIATLNGAVADVNGTVLTIGNSVTTLGGTVATLNDTVTSIGSSVTVLSNTVNNEALLKSGNLTGLADVAAARDNLDVYSKSESDAGDQSVRDAALLKANDLSDVVDKVKARENLGVYSTAQADAAIAGLSGQVLYASQNLNDVGDKAAARANLDIFSKADAAALFLAKAQNLADVADAAQARHNLGLDQAAYLNVAQDWTKPQRSQAVQAVLVGGAVTLDFALYQNFDLTLTANVSFANPTLSAAVVGQKGTIGITPAGFSIAGMGTYWKRVGDVGSPSTITGVGRIDYHIRSTTRVEYAYNDVEA